MRKLLIKPALMTVLIICAAGSAAAQGGVIGVGLYTGVESAAAKCEMSVALCYGNTFVLNSFGEWESFHLTVSLNYFNSLPNGGNGFAVTGGTWSAVVVRDNQYAGTLYGEVTGGSIVFPAAGNQPDGEKITTADLWATGGIGIFNGRLRKKIGGSLRMNTDLNSRQTTGRLDLNL